MPSRTPFTANSTWASNDPETAEVELTLPSGQNCLARKVTIEGLIGMGILTMADSLTPLMESHTAKTMKSGPDGPATAELNMAALMGDPESIKAVITLVDKIMPICVVSPVVKLHYEERTIGKTKVTRMIPLADRESGFIYTDQIGFEDKMWLFDWAAGGLKAMTSFRPGSTADVGGVVSRPVKRATPQRRPRTR